MPTVNLGSIIGPPGPKGDTGPYHFELNEAGELILYSAGDTAPNYRIDENGHLLIEDQTIVDLGNVVGDPGKSAYEFAQEGGYIGTETDFIEKLSREYLPVAGGIMTGPIDMNSQAITGLNDPIGETEAARKAYVDKSMREATPVNLLDNSDFTNPVNQRGVTNQSASNQYFIDRWVFDKSNQDATYQVGGADGISFGDGSWIFQRIPLTQAQMDNKMFTVVVWLADGTVWIQPVLFTAQDSYVQAPWAYQGIGTYFSNNNWRVTLANLPDCTIKYVALYEGEYTAETLPDFQAKGYATELLECQRYYRRYSYEGSATIILNGFISSSTTSIICPPPNTLPMRIGAPTVSFNGSVLIRGVNGYETQSGSSGYSQPTVDIYGSNTKSCPSIRIRKQDLSAWGLTNNTVVSVTLQRDSILELNADL